MDTNSKFVKKQFVKNDDPCDELFQVEMINDDFIKDWEKLKSLKPSRQETNCLPNVLFFLGIIERNKAQNLSYQTECDDSNLGMRACTHKSDSNVSTTSSDKSSNPHILEEDLDKVDWHGLLSNPNTIPPPADSILEAFNRTGIHVNAYLIDIKDIFTEFRSKLYTNNVTMFGVGGNNSIGHALAIGKDNDDTLIVFDPQQLEIYEGEKKIHHYLVNVLKGTYLTIYCNEDVRKRKHHNRYESINKKHDEPDSKIPKKPDQTDVHDVHDSLSFSHGTIPTKPKPSKASRRDTRRRERLKKNNGGKRKTKHSKRKTKHSKRKTKHSKRKTKHSKRKTKHSKRK
jgi:hypothetical protein